jgi:carboxymethylenebutenolidase
MRQLEHHQRYVIEEFAEAYQERRMSRRELLRRTLLITGSVPLSASVLFALGCGDDASEEEPPAATSAPAAPPVATTAAGIGPGVSESDPAIQVSNVRFPGPASDLLGYIARPAASGTFPGVIVIHENQGLLPHFKDVARRFAKEGFAALSVDLVSRLGGTSQDANTNMMALRVGRAELVADLVGYTNYLKTQTFVKASAGLGATGYCFGGGQTWELAAASQDIKAAAPYYGSVSPEAMEALGSTSAAIFAFYGADDMRITSMEPQVKERLQSAGKTIETKIYPGAGHAFFNEDKQSYNEAAAKDAWTQTLAWFRKHLTG